MSEREGVIVLSLLPPAKPHISCCGNRCRGFATVVSAAGSGQLMALFFCFSRIAFA